MSFSSDSDKTSAALADMVKARQTPVDPENFPGAMSPWPAVCMDCGSPTAPRVSSLRKGQGGCKKCGTARRVAAMRLSASDEADRDVRESGFIPLEPFSTLHHKWLLLHVKCGRETRMTLANIRAALSQGKVRNCWDCRNEGIRERLTLEEAEAVSRAMKKNKRPLVPYPGANTPWKCECLDCGEVVYPRLNALTNTSSSGCQTCGIREAARKNRTDSGAAESLMRKSGYEPLDPYEGNWSRWHSRHIVCGREVWPTLGNIQAGHGGCLPCTEYGFKAHLPAVLYVLFHHSLGSVKIGITGVGTTRLDKFCSLGWTEVKTWDFERGAEARNIERAVLEFLKKEKNFSYFLTPDQMPYGGWTETFDSSVISSLDLTHVVERYLRK